MASRFGITESNLQESSKGQQTTRQEGEGSEEGGENVNEPSAPDEAEASSANLEGDVDALAEWIREELGLDELSGENPMDRLKNGIELLVGEVEAGRADAEESGH
jgi:hypothetical protein